jgi:hypothetical protein
MDKLAHEEEELDYSQLSDEELLLLADEMYDEEESYEDPTLQKMASEGDLEYWDMAGRVMAHAYADEFDKVANAADPLDYFEGEAIDANYVDLNELDADDLYELALTKEAGLVSGMVGGALGTAGAAIGRRAFRGGMAAGRRGMAAARSGADRVMRSRGVAVARGAAGAQGGAAVKGIRNAANKAVAMGNRMASRAVKAGKGTAGYKGGMRAAKMHSRGVAFQRLAGRMSPALSKMSPVQAGQLATRIAMGGGAAAAAGGAAAYGMSRS